MSPRAPRHGLAGGALRYYANALRLKYLQSRVDEALWWGRSCGESVWDAASGGATFEAQLGRALPFPLEVIACALTEWDGLNSTKLTRLSAAARLTYLPNVGHQPILIEQVAPPPPNPS